MAGGNRRNAGPLPDAMERARQPARSSGGVAGLKKASEIPTVISARSTGLGGNGPGRAGPCWSAASTPADPAIVRRPAAVIRKGCIAETQVYNLSLYVMFLDRLGDSRDIPFIQSMGLRLLAGQNKHGGWDLRRAGAVGKPR